MRFLFGAQLRNFTGIWVPRDGILLNFAIVFQLANLAFGFGHNRGLDEAHGVHVFQLAPRTKLREIITVFAELFVIPRTAYRYVHVSPKVAVLHVAI